MAEGIVYRINKLTPPRSLLLPTVILPSPLLQEFVTMPLLHPPLWTALPRWNETVFVHLLSKISRLCQAHSLCKVFVCMFLLLHEIPLQLVYLVGQHLAHRTKRLLDMSLRHSSTCTGGAACCRHDPGLLCRTLSIPLRNRVGPIAYYSREIWQTTIIG